MPIGDLLAQISGDAPLSQPFPRPVPKRKAADDLRPVTEKLIKKEHSVSNSSRPISHIHKPTNIVIPSPKQATGQSSSTPTTAQKKVQTTLNSTSPVAPSTTEARKAPKKGSFAEIMARGKAAQTTFGPVGKIQHKPIEKGLSKKERQELKGQKSQSQLRHGLNGKPGSSPNTASRDKKNGKLKTRSSVQAVQEKKVKKAALATTGYTGTARSNPSVAQPLKLSASRSDGLGRSISSRHHTYVSEEEEEEEVEEDYYSDVSSDMEAAVFEVDEEEEIATRIARKEDEEALREEARLKREKSEKRRRLAAMARRKR